MKGSGVSALVTLIILLSTVIFLSIITTYYSATISRASSEVGNVGGECYKKANIAIINYTGSISTKKNLTIKNIGGMNLDIDSFRIYFAGKEVNYQCNDSDGILEVGEKAIFVLPKTIGLGPIKVIGRCRAMDEIDTRYLIVCGDGTVSFAEECEALGDCEIDEFPYGSCTANKKCEDCYCTGILNCSGSLTGCEIGSDQYCKYCVSDINYCSNCPHCGDGICNCGENSITCYTDCS